MLVGFAPGAGSDDLRPGGFDQGGPVGLFDGVTKAGFAEAAVVELADAEAGGRNRGWSPGSGVQGLGRILEGRLACGGGWGC